MKLMITLLPCKFLPHENYGDWKLRGPCRENLHYLWKRAVRIAGFPCNCNVKNSELPGNPELNWQIGHLAIHYRQFWLNFFEETALIQICFNSDLLYFECSLIRFGNCYPEILPEMIEWGPLCIIDLFQNKSVAYFNPK